MVGTGVQAPPSFQRQSALAGVIENDPHYYLQ